MKQPVFTELDSRMAVVERWSVLRTSRKQNIAEHSYMVAVIADRIRERLFADVDAAAVFRHALYHDYDETMTGDPPTYMKKYITEKPFAEEMSKVEGVPKTVFYRDIELTDEEKRVVQIVKIADFMEALIFLQMEMSMGNSTVEAQFTRHQRAFRVWAEQNLSDDVYRAILDIWQSTLDLTFGRHGNFRSRFYGSE